MYNPPVTHIENNQSQVETYETRTVNYPITYVPPTTTVTTTVETDEVVEQYDTNRIYHPVINHSSDSHRIYHPIYNQSSETYKSRTSRPLRTKYEVIEYTEKITN